MGESCPSHRHSSPPFILAAALNQRTLAPWVDEAPACEAFRLCGLPGLEPHGAHQPHRFGRALCAPPVQPLGARRQHRTVAAQARRHTRATCQRRDSPQSRRISASSRHAAAISRGRRHGRRRAGGSTRIQSARELGERTGAAARSSCAAACQRANRVVPQLHRQAPVRAGVGGGIRLDARWRQRRPRRHRCALVLASALPQRRVAPFHALAPPFDAEYGGVKRRYLAAVCRSWRATAWRASFSDALLAQPGGRA